MEACENNESLSIQIDRLLKLDYISTNSLSSSIFKVPNHLRQINEAAYEPQAVSIGPYHHEKDNLKTLEVYKWHYLKMLLKRRNETSVDRYVTELENMKGDARRFYSEPLDHIEDKKFVGMLLLDGCFIVELIRKSAMEELRGKDDPLLKHYILRTVLRDLLLVENQLPFFILSKLFELSRMPNDHEGKNFLDLAVNLFFSIDIIPGSSGPRTRSRNININRDVKHLLDLLHYQCISCDEEEKEIIVSDEEKIPSKERFSPTESSAATPIVPSSVNSFPSQEVSFQPSGFGADHPPELLKKTDHTQSFESFPSAKQKPISFSTEERYSSIDPESLVADRGEMSLADQPGVNSSPEIELSSREDIESAEEIDGVVVGSSMEVRFGVPCRPVSPKFTERGNGLTKFLRGTKPAPSLIGHEENNDKCQFIPSVTELNEAGVKFKKKKLEGGTSLFNITFDERKGVLSIPTLGIRDETESVLRNLVAYEQCCIDIPSKSKRFTEYVTFMDCLINTDRDVEFLSNHGVVENWLGDHQVVADMFNRICHYVLLPHTFCYAKTFEEVNKYCKKDLNRWMANLRHNYFNTPWALVSFIAAVFLLLLTTMQSVYSALSYHFN